MRKNTEITKLKKQFYSSLKCGTGEAFLLMRNNLGIDFSQYIIKGASRNFALDQQLEGSRAEYIYQFIKASKQKEKIIAAILKNLLAERGKDFGRGYNSYGLRQMCELAVIFYKNGHPEALDALITRVKKSDGVNYFINGTQELMEIAGIEGVLICAEVIGKVISANKDFYEDSYKIDDFQEKNKTVDVYSELKKAAGNNKYIDAYLQGVLKNKWSLPIGKKRKLPKISYKTIKEKIDRGERVIVGPARLKQLTKKDVEQLGQSFLLENDKKRLEFYLRIFSEIKFPYGYERIFEIAKGRNPENTRLKEFALSSLQYFSSNELRQYAIDKLKTMRNPADYLYILVSNYKKGDHKLLTELTERSDNYDYIHQLACGFITIYEKNHTKECKEPLLAIYHKMNCGIHRQDLINILGKNKVLPERIKEVLKYDSCLNYRKKRNSR